MIEIKSNLEYIRIGLIDQYGEEGEHPAFSRKQWNYRSKDYWDYVALELLNCMTEDYYG
jgi:hypothetical protein